MTNPGQSSWTMKALCSPGAGQGRRGMSADVLRARTPAAIQSFEHPRLAVWGDEIG